MKFKDQKVLVQWTGEDTINARLVSGAPKVTFEPGMVRAMEIKKAEHVCGKYKKFVVVNLSDLDEATRAEYLAYEDSLKIAGEETPEGEEKPAETKKQRKEREAKEKAEAEAKAAEEAANATDEQQTATDETGEPEGEPDANEEQGNAEAGEETPASV